MCGILGSVPALPQPDFERALDLLKHRGPDGMGVWQCPSHEATLGHRRLAILDLSPNGRQPMHYAQYTITYNGEIYNFPELRRQLQQKGHRFRTQTDTEVLLAGFDQWGGDLFAKLNGMWALAIWDRKNQRLVLSRDRFGKKPLYYAALENRFVFASEMKALFPFLPEVEKSPDFGWMKDNLFAYEPTEKCLIKHISRFPAAHWGVWQNGKLATHRHWNTLDHLVQVPGSYRRQVEEFRHLFEDACKIRTRSDVPIGTALSGGLDSSAVIATVAHLSRQGKPDRFAQKSWQHAFVASLPGTPLDETAYAKMVASHLGIPVQAVQINPAEGIDTLEESLWQFEELYITSPVPMMQTYRAARNAGVVVSLDGHGADELFSGYDTFLFHAFMDCGLNPFAIRNILQTYRALVPKSSRQFAQTPVDYRNYLRWVTADDKPAALKPHWKKELRKALSKPRVLHRKGEKITDLDRLGQLNKALYGLFHTHNLPTLLRNYDRYSMANGVEIRMPFLDHRVVSYCFSVPWTSKLRRGFTKALLRDAVAPLLPKAVAYRRTKMGFQSPIVDWLKGPWKTYFTDIINSTDFMQSDSIDAPAVKRELERIITQANVSYREGELAYAAITPYLWERSVLRRAQGMNR